MKKCIGFIGFGLIAGSIAKALKKNDAGFDCYVYNRKHPEVPDSILSALNDGTIDGIYTSLEELSDCGIIVLSAPVLINVSYLEKIKPFISEDCIITDVGSVKGNIHKEVKRLGLEYNFVGGHPMTGSNLTGYDNSSELIMENAFYILTGTDNSDPDKLATMRSVVEKTGAIPVMVDHNEHDVITAAISHLPHIIAVSLVNTVHDSDTKDEIMKKLAAGGFKDITRIASSSPEMWQSILVSNSDNIISFINAYISKLNRFKEAIADNDTEFIYSEFSNSRDYRDSIPEGSSGALPAFHEIYVDVPDVPGIIAIIATILSSNSVNIKNIGIVHNREYENGVLRIEFNNERDLSDAKNALKKYAYRIYDR